MQTGYRNAQRQPRQARQASLAPCRPIRRPSGRSGWPGVEAPGDLARAGAVQKDATSELLQRAFTLALTTRLKQYKTIDVDVRSTAWGLMEGKFGGLTVRGAMWRTPLELTAEKLMVEVGELVLDYQKLIWQQTVALKNVPQGSVSFTLTSQDLANFMVHPIMVAAATRAVQGHAFFFDRNTASVRLDPATGRGVITYQGIWAGNGQRYAIRMTTPPPPSPAAAARLTAAASAAALTASSNTLEQLTVLARRVKPAAARSSTGSYASVSSADEPLSAPVAAAAAAATMAAGAAAAAAAAPAARRAVTVTVAPPPPQLVTGAAALSLASAGSMDGEGGAGLLEDEADESELVVGEGLRRFFSALTLNLQGIELRQPVLLVQLPQGAAAAAAPGRGQVGLRPGAPAAPGAAFSAGSASGSPLEPLPALLTITMKVQMLSLPPLNMKF